MLKTNERFFVSCVLRKFIKKQFFLPNLKDTIIRLSSSYIKSFCAANITTWNLLLKKSYESFDTDIRKKLRKVSILSKEYFGIKMRVFHKTISILFHIRQFKGTCESVWFNTVFCLNQHDYIINLFSIFLWNITRKALLSLSILLFMLSFCSFFIVKVSGRNIPITSHQLNIQMIWHFWAI